MYFTHHNVTVYNCWHILARSFKGSWKMYCYSEFVIMQYSLNTHIYLVNKICCTIPLIYIQHNILCLDHTVTCSPGKIMHLPQHSYSGLLRRKICKWPCTGHKKDRIWTVLQQSQGCFSFILFALALIVSSYKLWICKHIVPLDTESLLQVKKNLITTLFSSLFCVSLKILKQVFHWPWNSLITFFYRSKRKKITRITNT